MMKSMKTISALCFLYVVSLSGCTCSGPQSKEAGVTSIANNADTHSGPQQTGKLKLLFFMNPAGQPCQMQAQILNGITSDLEKRADLVIYKTDQQDDIAMFSRFGVRSLPQLILADSDLNEKSRFSPGIQNAEQILGVLSGS